MHTPTGVTGHEIAVSRFYEHQKHHISDHLSKPSCSLVKAFLATVWCWEPTKARASKLVAIYIRNALSLCVKILKDLFTKAFFEAEVWKDMREWDIIPPKIKHVHVRVLRGLHSAHTTAPAHCCSCTVSTWEQHKILSPECIVLRIKTKPEVSNVVWWGSLGLNFQASKKCLFVRLMRGGSLSGGICWCYCEEQKTRILAGTYCAIFVSGYWLIQWFLWFILLTEYASLFN